MWMLRLLVLFLLLVSNGSVLFCSV
uniref:Uncharacterized protein n=1 Tax=Rhizophora mucronata TaxID=61149 RepID=A0A2P2IWW5_RHIMU